MCQRCPSWNVRPDSPGTDRDSTMAPRAAQASRRSLSRAVGPVDRRDSVRNVTAHCRGLTDMPLMEVDPVRGLVWRPALGDFGSDGLAADEFEFVRVGSRPAALEFGSQQCAQVVPGKWGG